MLTEKAVALSKIKVYTFFVARSATKHSIQVAITELFDVKVSQVRVLTKLGSVRRVGKKGTFKRGAEQKVAYITVKEGEINLFPKA